MNTLQVYKKYNTPINLQQHMLWVASIGDIICKNWKSNGSFDRDRIIKILLIHDIGNIILFNLDKFPIPGEDSEYWKQIQANFKQKYEDEHHAVIQIAKELGLDKNSISILEIMPKISLSNQIKNDWELAICWYADFRIAPNGITAFEKRLDDLIERQKIKEVSKEEIERLEGIKLYGIQLEKDLQRQVKINLSYINNKEIEEIVQKLKVYDI